MGSNRKGTGRASSMAAGLVVGLLCAGGVTLIGAAVFAQLLSKETLQESAMGYISAVLLILSSGAGAWVAAAKIKHRRMVVCMLSALCYLLLLVSCTALFFGGQYAGLGVTALIVLGTGCAVGLLGLRQGGKSKGRSTGKMYKKALHR